MQTVIFLFMDHQLNYSVKSTLEVLFIVIIVVSIMMLRLKLRKTLDIHTKLYMDLYSLMALPTLLFLRILCTTIRDVKWQSLIIICLYGALLIYRSLKYKTYKQPMFYYGLVVLLNVIALGGIFIHMMYYNMYI